VKNVKLCSTICQNFFHKNCVSRAKKKKTENFVKGKYNLQFKYRIREWRSQAPASCCSCRYILWLTQRVFLNGTSSRDRIKKTWTKWIVLGKNKNLYWLLNFQHAPLLRCCHCHFLYCKQEIIFGDEFFTSLFVSYIIFSFYYLQYVFQNYWKTIRGPRRISKIGCSLEYVLLVQRNLLECSCGPYRILLASGKCDFEDTSSKYYFSNMFLI
jgi:hypothetical protein